MDRNQSIGLVLISAILLVYVFFFAPKPPETSFENPKTDSRVSKKTERKIDAASTTSLPDSLVSAETIEKFGPFAQAASGKKQNVTLQNDKVEIKLSTQGGQVSHVLLKKYKTFDKKPLVIADSASSKISLLVKTTDGKEIDLTDLYYQVRPVAEANPGQAVRFVADLGNNRSVEKIYRLQPGGYTLDFDVKLNGISGNLVNGPAKITWLQHIKRNEFDLEQSRGRTTTNYYTAAGDFDYLSATSTDPEEEKIAEPVSWFGHKEKFFTSALISSTPFSEATFKNIPAELLDSSVVKTMESTVIVPEKQISSGVLSMQLFFGPNDYRVLDNVTAGFDKNLELGWGPFTWINKWLIIPVFDFLDDYLTNFGIIIILLVIFIKTILFPLTYKSYISMAKMRVLKPELDQIKEKHGGDLQKSQQESMQLYSKMGVNPVSGCIPMLLSMPILLAMFNFFPNSIELRQEAFLWANDLSTYDVFARLPFTIPFYGSHISMFTLLMTASTILYTWSNNQVSTMQGPMVFMSYTMPLVFLFVLNSFPAGLSFYYLVSNLVTFGQQAAIRGFIDEKKIRAKLEENAIKNKDKKKGGFQARLEEAMKASQERAAEAKKQPRRGKK